MGPATPSAFEFCVPIFNVGPTPGHLITTAAALRLANFLRHRSRRHLHLGFLLNSSFKKIYHLDHVVRLKDKWHKRAIQFTGTDFLQWSYNTFPINCMSLFFFNGDESQNNSNDIGKSYTKKPRGSSFNRRHWTNMLIAMNVLVYIAQIATQGKLLFWGAKINSLIDRGQLWRLATSSFLHANIGHLMVNCYSLNSVGPLVENISGPRRYVAVYITSAIASSAMSYCLCKGPAVGASGAIFGLVGSFAVFTLRHRGVIRGSQEDLQYIVRVIALNMVIGLLSKGIDNWGHLGGLIGGAATSWLLGPAWKQEAISSQGQRVFADRAPIFSLIKTRRTKS